MQSFWQDFIFGVRMLRRQPGFTAVALFTLALGIGANTAIFSVINGVLLKPLPYYQPERLVLLWERNPAKGMEQEMVTPPNLADWQAQQHVFEQIAFWTGEGEFNLVRADGSEKIRAAYVSSSLFPTLGLQPRLGRTFLPAEDQKEGNRVAVISYEFWQQRFGSNESALGQTITLDTYNKRDYTIVGVMPPGFQFPGKSEVWLPAGWNGIPTDRRGGHWLTVLARLKDGVTMAQAQTEMNGIQARIETQFPNANLGSQVAIVPLLEQTVGRNLTTALWILWGVIAAVLLIACANVANLTLARATARQKEIVIRLALGASRWQVVRQLLTENLLLAVAGGLFGLLLAVWGLNALQALSGEQVPRWQNVRLDAWALAFTLVVSLLTSLLCGLAPALQATKHDLHSALKESSQAATAGVHRNRLRSGLIIAEVALSLLLLIGAGLMLNSFARLLTLNRGFQPDHLLVAKLDFSVSGFTTWVRPTNTRPQVTLLELMQRLQAQPGVQAVAAVSALPRTTVPPRQGIILEQGHPAETPRVDYKGVSPDYFRTMGIALLAGRTFTEHDAFGAPGVVIINETAAKRWFPNVNPIGQRIAMEGRTPGQPVTPAPWETSVWNEIVGMVADTKKLNLKADTVPEVYASYWQYPMQTPDLLVRTNAPAATVTAAIRNEIQALNKNIPAPKMETMDALLADVVAEPRLQTTLLTLFGLTALVLAAIGIYSVMAYSVASRTQEIGIRMALGAQMADVLRLVIGQGMKLVLLGVALGVAAALALTRLLQSLLFGVSATDPLTFVLIVLLLLGVALLACFLPARRATKVEPMRALRHE
ncbi:MAG TPA: ABC transporter permease [Blastocatellia bacterium]|nr:ABC transporter permease [Blastocatellia bacterium]